MQPPEIAPARWIGEKFSRIAERARRIRIVDDFGALSRRFLLLLLILTGVLSGITAVAFHDLLGTARSLLIGSALGREGLLRIALIIAIPPAVTALLAFVILKFAPVTHGAGLARVRRAYAQDPSVLDFRTIFFTLVLTPLSLGAGVPLGPEGPTVVLTSGLSVWLGRLFRLPKKFIRGMIPVGTAAGIAAIFNTPITGVVFALEEILGTTSRGVLGGTIVAAVAAAVVERLLVGGLPILATPAAEWTDVRELLGFALVGVAAGFVSGIATRYAISLRTTMSELIASPVRRAAAGGLAIGIFGAISPSILGVGYASTSAFLHGEETLASSGIAFALKTAGFIVALATGLIGGTFAPSLFIGAALGSTVGHAAELVIEPGVIEPGAYALVGMGAVFGGIMRAPIASAIIVFEVTGDYGLILPLMLAVALSISISRKLSPLSLTERQLLAEGFREEEEVQQDPLASLLVRDVMAKDPRTVQADSTLLEAARAIAGTRHHYYPVVDDDGHLLGVIAAETIDGAAREGRVEEPVRQNIEKPPMIARSDESVRAMIWRMAERGADRCPVVDHTNTLVGFVGPSDLLHARLRRTETDHDAEFDVLG